MLLDFGTRDFGTLRTRFSAQSVSRRNDGAKVGKKWIGLGKKTIIDDLLRNFSTQNCLKRKATLNLPPEGSAYSA